MITTTTMIELDADLENGEGSLLFPCFNEELYDFFDLGALMRADLLQDWIGQLNEHYEQALEELYAEHKPARGG